MQPAESVAQVDRTAIRADLAQPDEEVGVGIVGAVGKLDHRIADNLQRLVQGFAGEGQHVGPTLESAVVTSPAGLITRPPTAGVGSAGS